MKLQNLFVLLAFLYLTGCTASFQFTKGDADGEKDGFAFGGIYASDANGYPENTPPDQISLCTLEGHSSLPHWTDNEEWTESITNSSPVGLDNQGSLSISIGRTQSCFPSPPDYSDNFVFFVKSPNLENDSGWQDLSSFTAHVKSSGLTNGIKVQLQAKVRKANNDEVFWEYKDSTGDPAFVSVPSRWLPIVFEMEDEPVTLLFISLKVLGNASQINNGGGGGKLFIDGIFAKK